MKTQIMIAGVEITIDPEGRFSLNALHRASGLGEEKAPAKWTRSSDAKALLSELQNQTGQICLVSSQGRNGGTFAHKLLAISYAGWISPAFQLEVNQVFLDYKTSDLKKTKPTNPLIEQGEMLAFVRKQVEQVPGVKPGIAMAQFLTAIQETTGVVVEPFRLALPPQEEPATLNPTQLGKLVGMSARGVNLELALHGLQIKNGRDEWELTEKGRRYAESYPFARNGHASYQILWKPEVQVLLGG